MSSGPDTGLLSRLPFRWRLAGASALLTLLILLVFALAAGEILSDRSSSDFKRDTAVAADQLAQEVQVSLANGRYEFSGVRLGDYVASQHARVLMLDQAGDVLASTPGAPSFGILAPGSAERSGYLIETRSVPVSPAGQIVLQYARPLRSLSRSNSRLWLVLGLGVLGGSLLALAAGLAVARRAMRPISDLTKTADEIARTRDPSLTVPIPVAQDEIRDLATTLATALDQLDRAQLATSSALERQKEFVADASHELRTPLTALIANLEMLETGLEGAPREDASAALAAARRMRDLVADLLMLAREGGSAADPTEVSLPELVSGVLEEVALEEVRSVPELDLQPATVRADRALLFRVVRNLVDNAHVHAAGAAIRIETTTEVGKAILRVEDGGPGIAADQRTRIFERFVRGNGESSAGTGLGLAIVRAAVEECGGTISVAQSELGGARFDVVLPEAQASTSTATTTGRRLS
jgi:signal transduction histidine kinase